MLKTLRILLWNQKVNDLEIWYAALGTPARSNLIPYAFVWEKGKIMDFSEIIVAYVIRVGRCILLNEYMNHYEYHRSRSFIELRLRSLRFNIFLSSFVQKPLGRLKPNFIWSLHEMWGMKICSNVPGHLTMPI